MILSHCGSFQAGPMWKEAELGTDVLAAMALNELTLYRVPCSAHTQRAAGKRWHRWAAVPRWLSNCGLTLQFPAQGGEFVFLTMFASGATR